MTCPIDWDALRNVFAPGTPDVSRGAEGESVTYLGEVMPRWLARDRMKERAAILEYHGGITRAEAEALAFRGLDTLAKKSLCQVWVGRKWDLGSGPINFLCR